MWIVAPGMTAPVGSVTVPCTGAELPLWAANSSTGAKSIIARKEIREYGPYVNGIQGPPALLSGCEKLSAALNCIAAATGQGAYRFRISFF
jgi:hypothetical protein